MSQQYFWMQNEENPIEEVPPADRDSNSNNLLSHLLQQAPTDRDLFQQHPPLLPNKSEPLPDQDPDRPQPFDLRTIQKQDFHPPFPEQKYQEQPEEDPLKIVTPAKRSPFDPPPPSKRLPTSTRAAYLSEARSDKLARYRDKKSLRVWHRRISYDCRKVVADKRERRNGRFVKKETGGSGGKSSGGTVEEGPPPLFKLEDYYG